jgi:serine protease Do
MNHLRLFSKPVVWFVNIVGGVLRCLPGLTLATLLASTFRAAPAETPEEGTNDVHATLSQSSKLNPPAAPRLGEPINDQALFQFLDTRGRKLVESGGTIHEWGDLSERKTCSLKLRAAASRKLTVQETSESLESAVVVVGTFYRCDKCTKIHLATASGFFLNESGAMATCRHVLANYSQNGKGMVVLTRDGRLCPVRSILAVDPVQDLLVLQVAGKGFTPLPLVLDAPIGSPVKVMSHPHNHYYLLTTGVVARYGVERRAKGQFPYLTITADFAKGSSGAPICNESGAVIGLADNTSSIYYTTQGQRQNDLQMVLKNCIPARSLLALVNGSRAP